MRIRKMVRGLTGPGERAKTSVRMTIAMALAGALVSAFGPSSAYAASAQRGEAASSETATSSGLLVTSLLQNRNGKYLKSSGTSLVVASTGEGFNRVADGSYLTLNHVAQNKNVAASSTTSSAVVLINGSGSTLQDWSVEIYGGDTQYFRLKNRATPSRCLGISGGSTGTTVGIFACSTPTATNQLWRYA